MEVGCEKDFFARGRQQVPAASQRPSLWRQMWREGCFSFFSFFKSRRVRLSQRDLRFGLRLLTHSCPRLSVPGCFLLRPAGERGRQTSPGGWWRPPLPSPGVMPWEQHLQPCALFSGFLTLLAVPMPRSGLERKAIPTRHFASVVLLPSGVLGGQFRVQLSGRDSWEIGLNQPPPQNDHLAQ